MQGLAPVRAADSRSVAIESIDLTFAPDGVVVATPDGIQTSTPIEGLSLSTALRDQLGLQLESHRGPAEVLVIDTPHLPAAN